LLRKAAEGNARLSFQFAVDTIQKHKIQPPGVTGWNDASNSEACMAGKLVDWGFAVAPRRHG